MIELSHNPITFSQHEHYKTIQLINHTHQLVIFKLKVTNLQLLNINPGKGYLQPKETIKLSITLKPVRSFTVKLMISSAVQGMVGSNFEVDWNRLEKSSILQQLINVERERQVEQDGGISGQRINQKNIGEQRKGLSNSSRSIGSRQELFHTVESLQKPLIQATNSRPLLTKTEEEYIDRNERKDPLIQQQRRGPFSYSYPQTNDQNQTNHPRQTSNYYQASNQSQINNSMFRPHNPNLQWTTIQVIILCLICFITGFAVGKND